MCEQKVWGQNIEQNIHDFSSNFENSLLEKIDNQLPKK